MIYVLMIIVFIDVFNYLFIKTGLISGGITYSYRRTKLIVMFATVVIVSMCAIGGYVRFCNPEVVKYPVEINKKVTTPVKIVIASDLHLGYLINKKITKNFVDFINAQQPDIVLFVGDIIDRSMRPLYAEKMYEELRNIKANIGVFGVWGNHEKYVKNDSIVKDFYSQSHIILLQDERIDLTPDIVLVGRDDYKNRQRDSLNSLLDGVDTSKIILVLDHQPSAANEAIKNNADILLCGHTHKGQVFPLNYVVSMMYKYSYGYKKVNKTNIIVSSGLGLCGGLFRIGTQSEIVVLNVE
ncbi:metallophosphatase [Bacteroidia bacterium]|nr:metallophosphatase [Bacteroidia bacterium]